MHLLIYTSIITHLTIYYITLHYNRVKKITDPILEHHPLELCLKYQISWPKKATNRLHLSPRVSRRLIGLSTHDFGLTNAVPLKLDPYTRLRVSPPTTSFCL